VNRPRAALPTGPIHVEEHLKGAIPDAAVAATPIDRAERLVASGRQGGVCLVLKLDSAARGDQFTPPAGPHPTTAAARGIVTGGASRDGQVRGRRGQGG
jgi:hypothetical protein